MGSNRLGMGFEKTKYSVLERVFDPEDLKKLSMHEKNRLADEIRSFLLERVSRTGGHLSSNLGVVELSIALHSVLGAEDELVWDVGHQSYVHKILTGRREDFHTLRQTGGISGFPKRKESKYDHFDTGHSSTSLSAALGIAIAKRRNFQNGMVVAVIGDGALTGGMAYEALNHLGHGKENVKIILNDNQMSISRNVGGMVHSLRASSGYTKIKKGAKGFLEQIPVIGKTLSSALKAVKRAFRTFFVGDGQIFEELGIKYLGKVDGHHIETLETALHRLFRYDGPAILHVCTQKGRGYAFAERDPATYHGVGRFDPESGVPLSGKRDFSAAFGAKLVSMAKAHPEIVAISAAMIDGTGLKPFASEFPDRVFDVGIAEQHAVTLAAGMGLHGLKPFVAIYSTFLQRAYDQILHDVCIQRVPVVFCIDRAGVVGADGETHQGIFDISYLSSIPGMTIYSVSDYRQLEEAMELAYAADGPVAVRYPRGEEVTADSEAYHCERIAGEPAGKTKESRVAEKDDASLGVCGHVAEKDDGVLDVSGENAESVCMSGVSKSGRSSCVVFTTGRALRVALEVQRLLKARYAVTIPVCNVIRIHPISEDIARRISDSDFVITIEDHVVRGGFGDSVQQHLKRGSRIRKYGFDRFIPHGNVDDLYEKYGLSALKIAEETASALGLSEGICA